MQSGPSSPQPGHRAHTEMNRMPFHRHPPPRTSRTPQQNQHQPPNSNSMPLPPPSVPPTSISAPPRSLVWREPEPFIHRRGSAPLHGSGMMSYPPPSHAPLPSGQMSTPGPSHLGSNYHNNNNMSHGLTGHPLPRSRFMDDGMQQMPPPRRDLPSLNWTREYPLPLGYLLLLCYDLGWLTVQLASQSSDLAVFSLSQNSSQASPSATNSRSSYSPRHFSPLSNQTSSARSVSSSERSAESVPTMNDLRIRGHDEYRPRGYEDMRARGQDDGFSLYPIFPSVNNLLSSYPSAPHTPNTPSSSNTPNTPMQDTTREGSSSSDMTLPPIRVSTLRRLGPDHGPGPPGPPGHSPNHDQDMVYTPEVNGDRRGPSR